jgi:hypothetical protein
VFQHPPAANDKKATTLACQLSRAKQVLVAVNACEGPLYEGSDKRPRKFAVMLDPATYAQRLVSSLVAPAFQQQASMPTRHGGSFWKNGKT